MARLTKEESTMRDMAATDLILAMLGKDRALELIQKNIGAYMALKALFRESGMTARQIDVLANEIRHGAK